MTDILSQLIDFESGELSADDTVDLFAELIRTDLAWKLQGFYGRTAVDLIDQGLVGRDGKVLAYPSEVYA